jgi:hypothetical protein
MLSGWPHHDDVADSCFRGHVPIVNATHWWDGVLNITALGLEVTSPEVQMAVDAYQGNRGSGSKIVIDAEDGFEGSFQEYEQLCWEKEAEIDEDEDVAVATLAWIRHNCRFARPNVSEVPRGFTIFHS